MFHKFLFAQDGAGINHPGDVRALRTGGSSDHGVSRSWLELLSVGRGLAGDPKHQFGMISSLPLHKANPWEVCSGEMN